MFDNFVYKRTRINVEKAILQAFEEMPTFFYTHDFERRVRELSNSKARLDTMLRRLRHLKQTGEISWKVDDACRGRYMKIKI